MILKIPNEIFLRITQYFWPTVVCVSACGRLRETKWMKDENKKGIKEKREQMKKREQEKENVRTTKTKWKREQLNEKKNTARTRKLIREQKDNIKKEIHHDQLTVHIMQNLLKDNHFMNLHLLVSESPIILKTSTTVT